MLDTMFLKVLDMTRDAGFVILLVLLARLALKRAPKIFSYGLWAVVLVRLLCPVSLEAPVSLVPQMASVSEGYTLEGVPVSPAGAGLAAYRAVGDALNGGLGVQHIYTTVPSSNGGVEVVTSDWWEVWILFGQYLWLVGMIGMAAYALLGYLRIRRRLLTASPLGENTYLADEIPSPFVLGLLRPRIYLPSRLQERELSYILLHERHHIRRGDHIWKALGFAALCIHWFNPLVWVAFVLAARDLEMSCDEAVIRKLGAGIRADYAASLLSLATGRSLLTPLAFGEGDTGGRIRNLAKWKKPALGVVAGAALVCAVLSVGLLTNSRGELTDIRGRYYLLSEAVFVTAAPREDSEQPLKQPLEYAIGEDLHLSDGTDLGLLTEVSLTADNFDKLFFRDGWQDGQSAAAIRRDNARAWRVVQEDREHYYVLQQKNGDIYLARGYYDASEQGDPYSDDTNLHLLAKLKETEAPEPNRHWDDTLDFSGLAFQDTLISDRVCNLVGETSVMEYRLTYTSPTVILEVGLLGADGREFSQTIRGGSGAGTLQNIPAGTYRLFVRNTGRVSDLPGTAVQVGVLHAAFDPATGNAALTPGTVYVPYECLFLNPLSSCYPWGGDSGYRYVIGEQDFQVFGRKPVAIAGEGIDGYSVQSMEVAQWQWQSFPYTDQQWDSWFFPKLYNTGVSVFPEDVLYQPLTDTDFLLLVDGEIWLVELHNAPNVGTYIWSIYRLVPESAMGTALWEYRSADACFRLEFDLPYTSVTVFAGEGQLVGTEDTVLAELAAGEPVCWSPVEADGTVARYADLQLTIRNGEKTVYEGNLYLDANRQTYTAGLVGTGLHLEPQSQGAVITTMPGG